MSEHDEMSDALAKLDVETDIQRVDIAAVAVLARSEVEAQIDTARKYPRSIKRFVQEATTMATLTREIAESCIYSLPRGGRAITGPSVRLAEMVASAYGNLHVGARVLGAEEREILTQGVAWDLEKNLRVTVETRRRITKKNGDRFDDDMITVTGNAGASVSFRNAIFRVVPRAYVDRIYEKVREVAVGTAQTLAARRGEVLARLGKMGITPDRVFARVGKPSVEDIGLTELETLIGLGTAIKNGDADPDAAFPPVGTPEASADTKDLEAKLRETKPANGETKKSGAETKAKKHETKREPPPPAEHVDFCLTCGKAIPHDVTPVTTTNKDGVHGPRHPTCPPATDVPTRREPGQEG